MSLIKIYEHQALRTDRIYDGYILTGPQLTSLREYHGEKGTPFFTLINNGVKFREWVGVIRVGDLTIEVLPKADFSEEKEIWQRFLIKMLQNSGVIDTRHTSLASLKLKYNSILDLYFDLFLKEVEFLIKTGLVKKYRQSSGNLSTLKGSLIFGKHSQQNSTHAERFYTRHTIYSADHILNQILAQTLEVIKRTGRLDVRSAARSVLLNMPELSETNITASTFSGIRLNRKTAPYHNAINIARLILLNFRPDVINGQHNTMALMFDMNRLWEKYVCSELKKKLNNKYPGVYVLKEQQKISFWDPVISSVRNIKPDIIVFRRDKTDGACLVLDTKWKIPNGGKPSDSDLQQMLIYNLYNGTTNSVLLYPGSTGTFHSGNFQITGHGRCSVMFLPLQNEEDNIRLDLSQLVNFLENI